MSFLSDYPQLDPIRRLAGRKKTDVYLVGGFLRDHFLGRPTLDFDFAVRKDAIGFARAFAKKIKGAFVLLDRDHGCARVVKKYPENIATFDFADFRGKTIRADLRLRDFTINTIALHINSFPPGAPLEKKMLFSADGLKDLKAKKIRAVSPRAFVHDPLRLLRAYSLKAGLGFGFDRLTYQQIRKDRELIAKSAAERIRDELFKILGSSRCGKVLKEMDKSGLLVNVIPQVAVMFDVQQGGYHHLDVWKHSLQTVEELDGVLREFGHDPDVTAYLNTEIAGGHSRRALISLAALLHDIGKPQTRRREEGRLSFHAHERVGRDIVRETANFLRLSTKERHTLQDIVLLHLRPGYLSNFKRPSEKAVFRYFRDAKDEAPGILLLSMADQRATRGPLTTEKDQEHHQKICTMLLKRYFRKKKEKPFVPVLSGRDLIEELRLTPSPLFKKILSEVEEKQATGAIKDRKQALDLAQSIAEKNHDQN